MSSSVLLTGFGLMASLIVAIGAQNTFVLRQGLLRQHVAAVVALCTVLDIALTGLGVSGLARALGEQPRLLDAVAVAGALALGAYGWAALRRALSPHALQVALDGAAPPLRAVLGQVLAISLLNPHVYLDTVLLAGAVGARQPAGTQGAFIVGAGLASGAWFALLGFGARVLRPWFARPAAWRLLDGLVALTMGALALRLLLGVLGA